MKHIAVPSKFDNLSRILAKSQLSEYFKAVCYLNEPKKQNFSLNLPQSISFSNNLMNKLIPEWSTPLKLGEYTLKNRVVLAAMTRMRCDTKTGIPNNLLVEYYGQRSGAGLLLTQCSAWSPRGNGYPGAGDLYNRQQAEGWKHVTDEVHRRGGRIYIQLYHAGRATHKDLNGGYEPWAPSAIAIREEKIHQLGKINYPTPKEMSLEDIVETQKQFEESIKLAKLANFDGIELHGANGYLIDQFLRSHTNRRPHFYGGSAQNRCRFVLQLIDIALKHFEPYQIGIKISPTGRFNDMFDENPVETYSHLLKELEKRHIGFVEIVQSAEKEIGPSANLHIPGKQQITNVCGVLRPHYNGIVIANNGFTPETGLKKMQSFECNAVSFARLHITNPDLFERIVRNAPLNTEYDYTTFYGAGLEDKSKGYTTYPLLQK